MSPVSPTPTVSGEHTRRSHRSSHPLVLLPLELTSCASSKSRSFSHSSFDEEMLLNLSKLTPTLLDEYKFLIYMENQHLPLTDTFIDAYMRQSDPFHSRFVCTFIKQLIRQYYGIENPAIESRLLCIGLVILNQSWTLHTVKQAIHDQFGDDYLPHCNVSHMRLRHVWSRKQDRVTRAYSDELDLKANCELINNGCIVDHMKICIETVKIPQRIKEKHVVLRCAKIYREHEQTQWQCDGFHDVLFNVERREDGKDCIDLSLHTLIAAGNEWELDYIDEEEPVVLFQQHAFHDFNRDYLEYYCSHHRWRNAHKLESSRSINIHCGDYLLFTIESIASKQIADIWQ